LRLGGKHLNLTDRQSDKFVENYRHYSYGWRYNLVYFGLLTTKLMTTFLTLRRPVLLHYR